MRTQVFFSIRVVKAETKKQVIDAFQSDTVEFDESHPLCDEVLTEQELVKRLEPKNRVSLDLIKDRLTNNWQLWYGQRLLCTGKTKKETLSKLM